MTAAPGLAPADTSRERGLDGYRSGNLSKHGIKMPLFKRRNSGTGGYKVNPCSGQLQATGRFMEGTEVFTDLFDVGFDSGDFLGTVGCEQGARLFVQVGAQAL